MACSPKTACWRDVVPYPQSSEEETGVSVYAYKCSACGTPDLRVASVENDTAVCHLCGGLMLRQNKEARDSLRHYFLNLVFKPLEPTNA
jgi:hypothetical protein